MIALATSMPGGVARADTYWTGAASQSWFNAGNWDTNTVPNAGADTVVPHVSSDFPLIDGGAATTQTLVVGPGSGLATLGILNGGTLTSAGSKLGISATGQGIVTVSGAGSSWTDTGTLQAGVAGEGSVKLSAGGLLTTGSADLGILADAAGGVEVEGAGTVWNNTNGLVIGKGGAGTVFVTNGGTVTSGGIRLSEQATSSYSLLKVDGAGSSVTSASTLLIGVQGVAEMTVSNGAAVNSGYAELGHDAGSEGSVTVENSGSTWVNSGGLVVGSAGRGVLNINFGGQVSSVYAGLAAETGSSAVVNILGAGASWTNAQNLTVGVRGEAELNINAGGVVTSQTGLIGSEAGSQGRAYVYGSAWINSGSLTVGQSGSGYLDIANGGFVSSASGEVGVDNGGIGTVTVAGAGSKWLNSGGLVLGNFGNGLLEISAGGEVGNTYANIGFNATGEGIVKVYGAGSVWNNTGSVYVGGAGTGIVTLSQAGKMTVGGNLVIGSNTGGVGMLVIGARSGTPSAAGSLVADIVDISATGSLLFNHTDTNYLFDSRITGTGEISHLAGTTVLTGASGGFTGTATVAGGTLRVDGKLGGTLDVMSGGTLAGTGTVGAVSIANGGTLSGVQGQTLTTGNLALASGSNVNVALGAPGNVTGLFNVGGNLTLDGTLNVADAGGFGQGVYRIFDYSGSLTDNGMNVGAIPTGTGIIQTAMANQVNLVVDNGGGPIPTVQFWNGTTTVADGTIHGGNGVWSAGPATNWTDANGALASAWGGNFAVFQNNPGNVTVDGSAGAISATGMQFIGTGWTVTGDPITLNGAGGSTSIRVGDGTAAGASHTATIGSILTGNSALVKDDLGTLILTGANSYTGGTTIAAGTLQIGNGGKTGAIVGNVNDNGALVFNRSNDLAFAGVIGGSGSIRQIGSGKVDLTGNSSGFTGATSVESGILAVNGQLGGALDIWAAGRLQGTGTVGNTVVSGTIAPGNSIGTINVGNITFNAGSIYEVEVNAAGQSDKITASGTATINGGSVKVLAGAGNYAPATQYTILTANGGRTGTFTDGVTSNLAFLDPSLSYDANNVYLTMTRNVIRFQNVGVTPNQIATGRGVESLGFGNPVYNAVLNLSAPQAQYAFDRLSGEIHASAKAAMIEDSRFVRNAVNDRLRAAFDGVGASGGPVAAYVDGKPVAVAPTTDGGAIWGQAFGSWGNWNSDGNAARLDRSIGGFFMGADARAFDTWRFGAVAGYSRTNLNVKDRHSSGSSDNYTIGLYGGTTWNVSGRDLAFRSGAAYTVQDISTSRSVVFPGFGDSLKGDYDAGTAQVFGELAYGMNMGAAQFEPFANLAYVNVHTDDFTEQGGAAALNSPSSNTDATFTTLGLRASTSFDLGGAALTATGTLGWRHAFGDVTPLSTMRFASGGDAFSIGGVPIARDAAVVEAALDYMMSSTVTLGVSYGGQFGSGVTDQSVKASFNMKF